MNTLKYLLRPAALSLLWLCVGLGCKKEEPEPLCETEGCCAAAHTVSVAATLNGVLINRPGANRFFITVYDEVYDKKPFEGKQKQITGLLLCDNQQKIVDEFIKEQQAKNPDFNPNQRYRVWGWAYYAVWQSSIAPERFYALKIKRMELTE
jgi:cytosine/uracil/thiamine/allantoin permease